MSSAPPVYFYIPHGHWPHPFPGPPEDGWPGYKKGIYAWTLQTFYKLNAHGFACELIDHLDGVRGIILAHQDLIDWDYKPAPGQLLVAMEADWGRHPYAQAHIGQNRSQLKLVGLARVYRLFWPGKRFFVHHWTQAGLIPRRGDRPEAMLSVGFIGRDINLAPELRQPEWPAFLEGQGIEWRVAYEGDDWRDYSEIDAVVMCRDFDGKPHYIKPATKLFNCCLAGCLPLCTPESAILDEMESEEDVVLVRSYAELKDQIAALQRDPAYFARMRRRAVEMGQRYTDEKLVGEWVEILDFLVEKEWPRWEVDGLRFRAFLRVRGVARRLKRLVDRFR